jgi:hypothetical protein
MVAVTEEQIMAIEIGEPFRIRDTIATPSDAQGYPVKGLPESLRIVVYSNNQGWYYSVPMAEPPFKQPRDRPPNPGEIVSSREEVLERVRQYLRTYFSD